MSVLTLFNSNISLVPIIMLTTFYVLNKYLLTKLMKFYVCFCVRGRLKEANYGRDQSKKQSQQQ